MTQLSQPRFLAKPLDPTDERLSRLFDEPVVFRINRRAMDPSLAPYGPRNLLQRSTIDELASLRARQASYDTQADDPGRDLMPDYDPAFDAGSYLAGRFKDVPERIQPKAASGGYDHARNVEHLAEMVKTDLDTAQMAEGLTEAERREAAAMSRGMFPVELPADPVLRQALIDTMNAIRGPIPHVHSADAIEADQQAAETAAMVQRATEGSDTPAEDADRIAQAVSNDASRAMFDDSLMNGMRRRPAMTRSPEPVNVLDIRSPEAKAQDDRLWREFEGSMMNEQRASDARRGQKLREGFEFRDDEDKLLAEIRQTQQRIGQQTPVEQGTLEEIGIRLKRGVTRFTHQWYTRFVAPLYMSEQGGEGYRARLKVLEEYSGLMKSIEQMPAEEHEGWIAAGFFGAFEAAPDFGLQIAPSLLLPGGPIVRTALFISMGVAPVYADTVQTAYAETGNWQRANDEAALASMITAGTNAVPAYAIIGRIPGGTALQGRIAQSVLGKIEKRVAGRILTGGSAEAVQEMSEQIGQEVLASYYRDKDIDWRNIPVSGLAGMFLGSGGRGAIELRYRGAMAAGKVPEPAPVRSGTDPIASLKQTYEQAVAAHGVTAAEAMFDRDAILDRLEQQRITAEQLQAMSPEEATRTIQAAAEAIRVEVSAQSQAVVEEEQAASAGQDKPQAPKPTTESPAPPKAAEGKQAAEEPKVGKPAAEPAAEEPADDVAKIAELRQRLGLSAFEATRRVQRPDEPPDEFAQRANARGLLPENGYSFVPGLPAIARAVRYAEGWAVAEGSGFPTSRENGHSLSWAEAVAEADRRNLEVNNLPAETDMAALLGMNAARPSGPVRAQDNLMTIDLGDGDLITVEDGPGAEALPPSPIRAAFAAAGPGHAKIAASLDALVSEGTVQAASADMLAAILAESDDAYLGSIDLASAADIADEAGRERTGRTIIDKKRAQIAIARHLAQRVPDGSAADLQDLAVLLEEYFHAGERLLLSPEERTSLEAEYANRERTEWVEYFRDGIAGGDKGAAEYAASNFSEWFAHLGVEHALGRRLPVSPEVQGIIARLVQALRDAIDRLRGRGEPFAGAGVVFDRLLGGRSGQADTGGLVSHFEGLLRGGQSFTSIVEARKAASEYLGRRLDPSENKDIDEAMEVAIVRVARDIAQGDGTAEQKFDAMLKLMEQQPNLSTRTSTSVANQAYSTPAPLAFLASNLAGITPSDLVFEPTAGNGMLLIGASTEGAVVNELEQRRFDALRREGFRPMQQDAADPALAKSIREGMGGVDVVIANPPFGTVRDAKGDSVVFELDRFNTRQIDQAISMLSLEALKPDGRAVLILGAKGNIESSIKDRQGAYRSGSNREFFFFLYDQFNVIDHFTVDGDLYRKQGAGFPVDVIVISGRGKSPRPLPVVEPPRVYRSWDELRGLLRDKSPATRPSDVLAADAGQSESGPDRGGAGGQGADQPAGVSDRPGAEPAGAGGPDAGAGSARPGAAATRPAAPVSDADRGDGGGERGSDAGGDRGSERLPGEGEQQTEPGPGGSVQRTDLGERPARAAVERKVVAETEFQVAYEPGAKSLVSLGTLVPRNMQTSISDALQSIEQDTGLSIEEFVASELNYDVDKLGDFFAAEQVDALAMAISNVKRGDGFIIGDQTGVGKGRFVAGMMHYAVQRGLIPVFVTEKPNLFSDIVRDLIDIGQSSPESPYNLLPTNTLRGAERIPLVDGRMLESPPPGVIQQVFSEALSNFAAGRGLTATVGKKIQRWDAIVTTYSQMQTVAGDPTWRNGFLLNAAPRSMFIFDESHNAGGQEGARPGAGGRSEFAREIVSNAAGTVFSSATYAKRPSAMDLYRSTDMRYAVDDPSELGEAIRRGGVPMQTVVANMLAEAKQYIRREQSYQGIKFLKAVVEVDHQVAEKAAEIFREIDLFDTIKIVSMEAIKTSLDAQGGAVRTDTSTGRGGVSSTNFTSLMHNIVDQLLFTVKLDQAADNIIASLKAGERPVVALSNTLESLIDRRMKEDGAKEGEPANVSFADVVSHYLERSREVLIKRPGDKKGEGEVIYLSDAQLGPAGVHQYNKINELIDNAGFDKLPASPIDYLEAKIEAAGFKVGEITGRDVGIDYSGPTPVYSRRAATMRSPAGRTRVIENFQNAKIDVVIINQAGSTGLSLHADMKRAKDTRKRRMFIVQAERNIDTFMQTLGRINRTGQNPDALPEYTLLLTDLPIELRPASVLTKKLASLNANVTADSKGAVGFDVPDVMNIVGDEAAWNIANADVDLMRRLSLLKRDNKGRWYIDLPGADMDKQGSVIAKLTGRVALLPPEEQKHLWDLIENQFKSVLEEKRAAGENPLEAETMDLKAETLSKTEVRPQQMVGKETPFAAPVYIERVMVDAPPVSMTTAEVRELLVRSIKVSPEADESEIIDAGKHEMGVIVEKAMGEFDEYFQMAKRHGLTDDQLSGLVESEKAFGQLMQVTLGAIGRSFQIEIGQEVYPGVLVRVRRTGKTKNPVALSSWSLQFATPSPWSRNLDIAASRLVGDDAIKLRPVRSLLSEFDAMQKNVRRERYIATGNLLAAAEQFGETPKQIIHYTKMDGGMAQGMLLTRSFEFTDWVDNRPVIFTKAANVLAFMQQDNIAWSKDSALSARFEGKSVIFSAPRAKSSGGRYYLNSRALAAAGEDFISRGDRMVLTADKSRASKILEAYYESGVVFKPTGGDMKARDAAQLIEGVKSSEEMEVEMRAQPAEEEEGDQAFGRAFHGSPYTFDRFSTSKIGTGEGAQAYGHGLYFAGKREVAEYYKNNLSQNRYEVMAGGNGTGAHVDFVDAEYLKGAMTKAGQIGHLTRIAKAYKDRGRGEEAAIFRGLLEQVRTSGKIAFDTRQGRLYEVELAPQEDEYLLWDRPLSEQSEKVKTILVDADLWDGERVFDTSTETGGFTGQSLYRNLINASFGKRGVGPSHDEAASAQLHALGIRGIKYLDNTSRHRVGGKHFLTQIDSDGKWHSRIKSATDDAVVEISPPFDTKGQADDWARQEIDKDADFNYVIFDESDVQITQMFGRELAPETPEFKAWFGDSKVVDEQGKPLVVYHGTDKGNFNEFENRGGKVTVLFSVFDVERSGFFFTPNEGVAQVFGDNVRPFYLSIQKPANFRETKYYPTFSYNLSKPAYDLITKKGYSQAFFNRDAWEYFDKDDALEGRQGGAQFIRDLQSLGYDGAIIEEPINLKEHDDLEDYPNTYVAFSPAQIKSVNNTGAFDPSNPDIRFGRAVADDLAGPARKGPPPKPNLTPAPDPPQRPRIKINPDDYRVARRHDITTQTRAGRVTQAPLLRTQMAVGRVVERFIDHRPIPSTTLAFSPNAAITAVANILDHIGGLIGHSNAAGVYSGSRAVTEMAYLRQWNERAQRIRETLDRDLTAALGQNAAARGLLETFGFAGMQNSARRIRQFTGIPWQRVQRLNKQVTKLTARRLELVRMGANITPKQQAELALLPAKLELTQGLLATMQENFDRELTNALPEGMTGDDVRKAVEKAFGDFSRANEQLAKAQLAQSEAAPLINRYLGDAADYAVVTLNADYVEGATGLDRVMRWIYGVSDEQAEALAPFQVGHWVMANDQKNYGQVMSLDIPNASAKVRFVNRVRGTSAVKTMPFDMLTPASKDASKPLAPGADGAVEMMDSSYWRQGGPARPPLNPDDDADLREIVRQINAERIAFKVDPETPFVQEVTSDAAVRFDDLETRSWIAGKRRQAIDDFFFDQAKRELGLWDSPVDTWEALLKTIELGGAEVGFNRNDPKLQRINRAGISTLGMMIDFILERPTGIQRSNPVMASILGGIAEGVKNYTVAKSLRTAWLSVGTESSRLVARQLSRSGFRRSLMDFSRALYGQIREMTPAGRARFRAFWESFLSTASISYTTRARELAGFDPVTNRRLQREEEMMQSMSLGGWMFGALPLALTREAASYVTTGRVAGGRKRVPVLRHLTLEEGSLAERRASLAMTNAHFMRILPTLQQIHSLVQSGAAANPGAAIRMLKQQGQLPIHVDPHDYVEVMQRISPQHLERLAERLRNRDGIGRIMGMDFFEGKSPETMAYKGFMDFIGRYVNSATPTPMTRPITLQDQGPVSSIARFLLMFRSWAMADATQAGRMALTQSQGRNLAVFSAQMGASLAIKFIRTMLYFGFGSLAWQKWEELWDEDQIKETLGDILAYANLWGPSEVLMQPLTTALFGSDWRREQLARGNIHPAAGAIEDVSRTALYTAPKAFNEDELTAADWRRLRRVSILPETFPFMLWKSPMEDDGAARRSTPQGAAR